MVGYQTTQATRAALQSAGTVSASRVVLEGLEERVHTASAAQSGLWFLSQIDSRAYNIAFRCDLHGRLDHAALQVTLTQIVNRHESLRTWFRLGEKEVLQVVAKRASVDLAAEPMRGEAQIERALRETLDASLNLSAGPLVRFRLLAMGARRHVLVVCAHHTVMDGWSCGLFIDELVSNYSRIARGDVASEVGGAAHDVQYIDFTAACLTPEALAGQAKELAYWQEKLADAPILSTFPSELPRPSVRTTTGLSLPFRFTPAELAAVEKLARGEGATRFAVLLAVFKATLFRCTGQSDLVVGTPVANRGQRRFRGVIGNFANLVALRTSVLASDGIEQIVAKVRRTTNEAVRRQGCSFDRVIEQLNPPRSAGISPLFQVVFSSQSSPFPPREMAGLKAEFREIATSHARYDLAFDLQDYGDGLEAIVTYNTALFERRFVDGLISCFRGLLAAAAAAPELPIVALDPAHDSATPRARRLEPSLRPQVEPALVTRSGKQAAFDAASVVVVDRAGGIAAQDMIGELCLLPEIVATTGDNQTLSRLLASSEVVRTGVTARYAGDGSIESLGPWDDDLLVSGVPFARRAVLDAIMLLPGVALATCERDTARSARVKLTIVPHPLASVTKDRLLDILARLAPNAPLTIAVFGAEAMGGPEQSILEFACGRGLPSDALGDEAADQLGQALAEIWAEVLDLPSVTVDENYFELGGSSLQAILVIHEIKERLKLECDSHFIFECPTPNGLARRLMSGVKDAGNESIPRSQHQDHAPLTRAQSRLWFVQQLLGASAAYNICGALELKGDVDEPALKASIDLVVSRHQALRTRLDTSQGAPFQVFEAHAPLATPTEMVEPEDVQRIISDESARPFDFQSERLARFRILRSGPAHWFVVMNFHHMVADGWSISAVIEELSEAYGSEIAKRELRLPAVETSFADYAHWEAAGHDGTFSTQLTFWRERLEGMPTAPVLPTDYARPDLQGALGAKYEFALTRELSQHLTQLARSSGATLFATLLAGFSSFLARYTGQADFAIGVMASLRSRPELKRSLGFLINAIVHRSQIPGTATLRTVIVDTSHRLIEAFAHQEAPFDRVVETLGASSRGRHTPIFQIVFEYEEDRPPPNFGPSIDLTVVEAGKENARFDLTLFMKRRGDRLIAAFEYNRELFSAGRIERMADGFVEFLEATTAAPDARLAKFSVASQREVLEQSSATLPESALPPSVLEAIWDVASRSPDSLAVSAGETELTFKELQHSARIVAANLAAAGVRPGDRVGIATDRTIDLLPLLLGVMEIGAAYVPLDISYPARRLETICRQAELVAIIGDGSRVGEANASIPTLSAKVLIRDDGAPLCAGRVHPESPAYVLFTSGSTGEPKGVVVSHHGLASYLAFAQTYFEEGHAECGIVHSSIGFDATITTLLGPLVAGRYVRLLPMASELPDLVAELQSRRSGVIKITPAHLEFLAPDIASISRPEVAFTFVVGGERLPGKALAPWRRAFPNARFINEYGPTETVVGCTIYTCGPDLGGDQPIGFAIPGATLHLLDEGLNVAPVGCLAEIYIGGRGVASGYLGQPVLTAERFLPDPFGPPGSRLYRTGDFAVRAEGGELIFHGRRDDQVKIRGHRVELAEIEHTLKTDPRVASACVLFLDADASPTLQAFCAASESSSRENPATQLAADLGRLTATHLPPHMRPGRIHILPVLPTTAHGKVDRDALRALARRTAPEAVRGGVGTSLEARVCAIWSTVLGHNVDDPQVNFFDAGGHSLLLMGVCEKISQAFGKTLTPLDLLGAPTPAAIAALLTTALPVPVAPEAPPRRVAAVAKARDQIAVVGMAARLPGANDIDEFWRNVEGGVESIETYADAQLLAAGIDADELARGDYVKRGAMLQGIELFDAALFGLTASEAKIMDPQQRLALQCALEALDNAGMTAESHAGRIGVYFGKSEALYLLENVLPSGLLRTLGRMPLMNLNSKSYAASQISYRLGLTGPSVSVDTACSTSLVAIHEACISLLAGQCEVALAGGVSIDTSQPSGYRHVPGDIASRDGRCRPFSRSASGTLAGSGCGIVVLKRLSAAVASGDTIHAVIRGSAVNNDGHAKAGFTAPSIDGQVRAIEAALAAADVDPSSIGYVEAHGTATELGDQIELSALHKVFDGVAPRAVALGSVKSNIGHLDVAAGVVGLIKSIQAIKHKRLPPSLHCDDPVAELEAPQSPLRVLSRSEPWPSGPQPRRAGVSSFGLGGTNAHVVLEEAPEMDHEEARADEALLLLSARSPTALAQMTRNLAAHAQSATTSLADASHTLRIGRKAWAHRAFVVAADWPGAATALEKLASSLVRETKTAARRPVVFMFPGQGAQRVGMGRALYEGSPEFASAFDACADALLAIEPVDLREVVYPLHIAAPSDARLEHGTYVAQCGLFAFEYALAKYWMSLGLTPEALIGHSTGEYVAACLAGIFTVDDAIGLLRRRGALMESAPQGCMLAVSAPSSELEELVLQEGCDIAAVNATDQCVVAGSVAATDSLRQGLEAKGIQYHVLNIPYASHSRLMDGVLPAYEDALSKIDFRSATIPVVSNVTGAWMEPDSAASSQYWVRHLRSTVKFHEGLATLSELGEPLILELGPSLMLGKLAQRHSELRSAVVASCAADPGQPEHGDDTAMLIAAGRAWAAGHDLDWSRVVGVKPGRRAPLPSYPFEMQAHWLPRRPLAVTFGSGIETWSPKPDGAAADLHVTGQPVHPLHQAPDWRDDIEEALSKTWRELIGSKEVERDDNFFELGGDSLLATRIMAWANATYRTAIPIRTFFENPTIESLASEIRLARAPEKRGASLQVSIVEEELRRIQGIQDS